MGELVVTGTRIERTEFTSPSPTQVITTEQAAARGVSDTAELDIPEDWRARVLAGADRKQSRTARENLTLGVELPNNLPSAQRRLVDFVAPGLRSFLGYA